MTERKELAGGLPPHPSVEDLLARAGVARTVPSATYRLQFNAEFTLADAAALTPYLHALGISHIYASPLFAARGGSTHGYDVCDPTRISPALGGQEAFDRLTEALTEHGMGLLLDLVPNHMGINDTCNLWWLDVLENGPSSLYAPFFDVDWEPSKPELKDRVLLPVLEDQYGTVLEAGKLKLVFSEGALWIEYYDNRFPVAPGTYGPVLEEWLRRVREAGEEEAALELKSVVTAAGYLPGRSEREDERRLEQAREKEIIKRRLTAVWQSSPTAFSALQQTLAFFNGDPADAHSFDPLDALIQDQAYRFAYWRVAGEEINYRRFFDIRDLAAIRVEDPEVFEATHAFALSLLAQGKVGGLRIDHPDGLFLPAAYFRRLQLAYLFALTRQDDETDEEVIREEAERWLDAQVTAAARGESHAAWPIYVVAEKILSDAEPLPLDWAVDGTTGYDFLASVNGVLVNPASEDDFTRIYSDFTGEDPNFEVLAVSAQRMIMREALASEINELSHGLERIAERNRHTRDYTLNNLRDATRSLVASLPVYRTYIDAETGQVSERDRRYILEAVKRARALTPHIDPSVFRFLQDTLLLENHAQFREDDRPELAHWVMKFQQITGPVMAKGVEDTAFYRYNRLISLNEVGGHPSLFGIDAAQFHKDNERRVRYWPDSMLTTSTHDNKRSEDVRARLNVLSELPEGWAQCLLEWSTLNVTHKTPREGGNETGGALLPDRNDEYLLYQTLLGAWPLAATPEPASSWGCLLPPSDGGEFRAFVARMGQYVKKAVKEAKVHGSWINPDEAYDQAIQSFVADVLHPGKAKRFLASFARFAARISFLGQINSLAQVALKLTSPGMPDVYQGNELWDFSLVDPDNRRPIDYAKREALLSRLPADDEVGDAALRDLLENSQDGRIKLFVTSRLLTWRRPHGDLFRTQNYSPLAAAGAKSENVLAFARRYGEAGMVVVAPHLPATLLGDAQRWPIGPEAWDDTTLALPGDWPRGRLVDVLTGRRIESRAGALALREVLDAFPLSVLRIA